MAFRVRVTGAQKTRLKINRFGRSAKNLGKVFKKIAEKVKFDAIPLTPTATGALVRSLRTGNGKTKGTVRAGGRSRKSHGGGVYAPIAHYGTYTHESKGRRPFLSDALERNEGYTVRQIEQELERLLAQNGLT